MLAVSKQKVSKTKSPNIPKKTKELTVAVAVHQKVKEQYFKDLENIIKLIRSYTKHPKVFLLQKAFDFAFEAHVNQLRKSGLPYFDHCIETAKILTDLRMDPITIAAGLLHDVVEDTGINIQEVNDKFGVEVGQLVDGVTKISELKFQSHAEKQAENFRKMIFSMVKDLRVIIIKFADRLHNMRTLQYLPDSKAKRIALETRDVYAPLAHRFGIARIKWQFEDLSLKILDPEIYQDIELKVDENRKAREQYIQRIANPIKKELLENNIKAVVHGRAKSFYSIFKKIKDRHVPFEEIYDLLAIRVITKKVDECYFALGVIHTLFTPVHDRFRDYIATPKLNMYQSLHSTVMGPDGKLVEIQFRTEEMHRIAEIGIAAHWKYKEQKHTDDELDRYSTWLREMIDWQKDNLDPEEYLDILKTDLFISEVFVFTPKGDLLKLPIGATPVDFAFAVHTDIGFQCIGAKVNGRIIPLNTKLKSGDSVEIITSSKQHPSQDWLTFVKSSKAKSKIKAWYKEAKYLESVKLGEEILSQAIKRYRIKISKEKLNDLASEFKKKNIEQIYGELGQGDLSLQRIIKYLEPEKQFPKEQEDKENLFEKFISKARGSAKGIRVQGLDNLLIRFAHCCHPVPGDSIVGFISKGRGIIVHRRDCMNAINMMENKDRSIEVSWDVDGEESFLVQLRILATGRKDFLKDMAESLSQMKSNVLNIDMNTENAMITAFLIVEVNNLSHLSRIMRKVYRLQGVISVERTSSINKSVDLT